MKRLLLLASMTLSHASFDQDFFSLINLNTPGMESIRTQVQTGNFDGAFDSYRDTLLLRLRRADLGEFGWHSYQTHPRPLSFALRLVDSLSESAYVTQTLGVDFMDTRRMSGKSGTIGTIRWDTPLTGKDDYSWFKQFTPLTVKYHQTRSTLYLDKYMELASQFATNQKIQVLALPVANQKQFNCNYSQDAQTALNQGFRISQIVRQIGLLAKSMATTDPKPTWADVLRPNRTTLPATRMDLMDSRQLAHIVYSLIVDHPYSMFARFENAGAVPNQRFEGLSALMQYPLLFPEFKTIQSDLGPKVDVAMVDFAQGNFFADGAMLEQSFNYNTGDLGGIEDLNRLWQGTTPWPGILALQKGELYFRRLLAASSLPMGGLPRNGNSSFAIPDSGWTHSPVQASLLTGARNSFTGQIADAGKDTVTDVIQGKLWGSLTSVIPFSSVAFPHMGYYSLRKNWTPQSPYLWMNGARQSRGHDSPDANSIQVSAFGRSFLIVAGVQWYSTADCPASLQAEFGAFNKYFDENSTWKANTILVNDSSQNRGGVAVEAYSTYKSGRFHTSDAMDLVESTYDQGFQSITDTKHFRRVVFIKALNAWIIHDQLTNSGTTNRAYTQLWNYSPEFSENQVVIDATAKMVRTQSPQGPNLEDHIFATQPLTFNKYYGAKGTRYLGWYKAGLGGSPTAKNDVHVRFSGKNAEILNLFVAQPGATSTVASKTDLSNSTMVGFDVSFKNGDRLEYRALRGTSQASIKYSPAGNVAVAGMELSSSDSLLTAIPSATKLSFGSFAFTSQGTTWSAAEIAQPDQFSWSNAALPVPSYFSRAMRTEKSPGPVTINPQRPRHQGKDKAISEIRYNLLGRTLR